MKTQEKQILIDQILDLLNTNEGRSETDSLRISEDYQPRNFRFTKEELEDIQFQFLEEEQDRQKENQMNFKRTGQNPDVNSFKSQFIKRPNQFSDQQGGETALEKIKRKNSIKLGQVIKRKISEKEAPDDFTKKYDSLFDEVFSHEKKKQEKQEKKEIKRFEVQKEVNKVEVQKEPKREQKTVPIKMEEMPKIVITQDKRQKESEQFDTKMNEMKSIQDRIKRSQNEIMTRLDKSSQSRKAERRSPSSGKRENLSKSSVEKFESPVFINKPTESEVRNRKSLQPENTSITIENAKHRKLSESLNDSVVSNGSETTIGTGNSFSQLPDIISRDSFNQIVKQYAHKPHLIQAMKPKIKVAYAEKKEVEPFKFSLSQKIVPSQPQAPKINQSKPAIKFSYGSTSSATKPSPEEVKQPYSLSLSKESKVEEFATFTLKQESRLPIFLRKLRELTNIYPNFYTTQSFTSEHVDKWNKQLQLAFEQCKKAIKTLKAVHLKYHELIKMVKELYKKMSKNIEQKKGEEDKELMQYFLGQEWNPLINFTQLQDIKPHDLFEKRVLNELQFMSLLNSYEELLESTNVESVLKIGMPMSVKIYMDHRDKLWAIEKNLRIMSEDFYLKVIIRVHIPQHIIDAHKILKLGKAETVKEKNRELDCLVFLRDKKDVFSLSWLGKKAISLLKQN